MHTRTAAVLGLLALASNLANAQTYTLTIDPNASGLTASMGLEIDTAGSLVGDWDPDSNTTGTRTKPGLFGSFGSTENLPADVEIGIGLAGDLNTQTSGSLSITIDLDAGLISITGLGANLVAGGPAAVPATLSLAPQSFRTRQPDSTYVGIPINLPIGELAITALTLTQVGGAAGVLVEIEPGLYSFAVAGSAELAGTVEMLGAPTDIPPTPTALALAGEILLVGDTATLTSVQTFDLVDLQNPDTPLPEFPMDLPTILPPGETAHLLMNLVLAQVATTMVGELALSASGPIAACASDFNGDGTVNTLDVLAFLNAWNAGDPEADFNDDGTVDTRDVLAFLNAWVAGC